METLESNPVGYLWLAEHFGVITMPHWRESRVLVKGTRRVVETEGRQVEYLPVAQNPGENVFAHLEFALRKEGMHLELLRKVLVLLSPEEATDYVRSTPTGRYSRIVWWLFETFSNVRLDLPDVQTGNYVNLLNPEFYVTGPTRRVKRQRVNNNLLGKVDFSPMVRWEGLARWSETQLQERCKEIVADYPAEIFERAVRYLYAKESKSSYEIERETPDHKRAETFIGLLRQAWHRSFLTKEALVELHKAIVDPRFANNGWRSEIDEQIYVGETLGPGLERVHYAAPKPADLNELMGHFLSMGRQIVNHSKQSGDVNYSVISDVPTLVAAAVISFVFDFLHPFSDGNGRIHRFLLHHVLAHNNFGPKGIILPVSAVILNRPREYDQALESFSKPLMERIEYTMDDRQRMTVTNDTVDFYRYIDCTELTRITIDFIRETIETELPSELQYLTLYDVVHARMRDVVEMPDRHADLFIKLVRQNDGALSGKKRKLPEYALLTDSEIEQMEKIIRDTLAII